jgi:hypothetical protein
MSEFAAWTASTHMTLDRGPGERLRGVRVRIGRLAPPESG